MIALLYLYIAACPAPATTYDDPRLFCPPALFVADGSTLTTYTNTWTRGYPPNGDSYEIDWSIGTETTSQWSVVGDGGTDALTISVSYDGYQWPSCSTQVVTTDGTVAATKLVLIGDSLIDNNYYAASLAGLCASCTLLGTQSGGGVSHEGYSGQTWQWFAGNAASPLTDGSGNIDIAAYITAIGDTPDVVIWQLGINDCYAGGTTGQVAAIAARLAEADVLIAAFAAAAPGVIQAIVPVIPGSTALETALGDRYYRWAQTYIEHWAGDGSDVWIVPSGLCIDRVNNYADAIHPAAAGYAQLAACVYAWLALVR